MEINDYREKKPHGNADYSFAEYKICGYEFTTNHWHDEIEIIYILHGNLRITVNGNHFCGGGGDIFAVNRGEMHELYGESADLEYYAFVFNVGMLSFSQEDATQRFIVKPLMENKIKLTNRPKVQTGIFDEIIECNKSRSVANMLKTKSLLLFFLSEIFESGQYDKRKKDADEEIKKAIIFYINNEFDRRIALDEISKKFNMSPKYFCRFFKKSFGKTFTEYLNGVRTEKAMDLLSRGMSVTDAAIACGFNNMSYFAKVFRHNTGINPVHYKSAKKS